MDSFQGLVKIARRKNIFDQGNNWSNGSETYLSEIQKELVEVEEEIPKQRFCYLEDELADVLWDYLNIVLALEDEAGVDFNSVLERACRKYEERISGIENGQLWKEIKVRQKKVLESEQAMTVS